MPFEVKETTDDGELERFLLSRPESTLYQCPAWARFMKDYLKAEPHVFIAKEGGATHATATVFKEYAYQRLFFETPLESIASHIGAALFSNCSSLQGPVADSEATAKALMERVVHEMAPKGIKSFSFTPPVLSKLDWDSVFTPLGFERTQWATYVIDLTKSEEELWSSMRKSGRKAVEKSREQGITVSVGGEEDSKDIYKYGGEEAKRDQKRQYSMDNLTKLWEHLRPSCIIPFIARENGQFVGSMFALEYNGNVTEMSVVRSDYAVEKNLYPGDAIKWAIIKWGHGQGFRTYDLAGVNPNPETPKEQGIRQFKEKWGGEYVEYPIFTKRT